MPQIFTPYRVCPLGAHVDHQLGRVTGFALDRGVMLEFEKTEDGSVDVESRNFAGKTEFNIDEVPERQYSWGDFIKGVVVAMKQKYELKFGIKGVVEGTLPVGGLSSSAAVILTYLSAFSMVNDIHLTQHQMIKMAIWTERNYIGVNVGKLDQSCEVYCRKDHLLYLDTKDDSIENIFVNPAMKPFEIMIAFSGIERKLAGSAYNTRVDECKAAAYALKAYAHMDYGKYEETYLRDIPFGVYEEYKSQLPKPWAKRAKHFFEENQRVKMGVKAWRKGDIEAFGELITQSGESSIYQYQTGSDELKTLHDIAKGIDGVYGGRFSGAGFNGCFMAIVDPDKKDAIEAEVTRQYLSVFPELSDKFSVAFCKTADGVRL